MHRVLLNVPVFKGFNFVPSQDRFLSFASTVTGIEVSVSKVTPSGVEDQNAAPSSSQFQQYLCRVREFLSRRLLLHDERI